MKTFVIIAIGSVLGLTLGWYVGYIHSSTTANRRALQYMDKFEPEYIGPTLLALRTIPLVTTGDTNAAVERLSDAIADYYRVYGVTAGTNKYRVRARSVIEAMAQTNHILASRIEHKMTNKPLSGFERVWVEKWKDYVYVGEFTNAPHSQKRFGKNDN
jgi:hypothetical protein